MVACGWYLEFSFKTIHAAERLLKHHLPSCMTVLAEKNTFLKPFFPGMVKEKLILEQRRCLSAPPQVSCHGSWRSEDKLLI